MAVKLEAVMCILGSKLSEMLLGCVGCMTELAYELRTYSHAMLVSMHALKEQISWARI